MASGKANPVPRNPYARTPPPSGPRPGRAERPWRVAMAPHGSRAMHVTVRRFAAHRDIAGSGDLKVRLPDGATLRDLLETVTAEHPRLRGLRDTMQRASR